MCNDTFGCKREVVAIIRGGRYQIARAWRYTKHSVNSLIIAHAPLCTARVCVLYAPCHASVKFISWVSCASLRSASYLQHPLKGLFNCLFGRLIITIDLKRYPESTHSRVKACPVFGLAMRSGTRAYPAQVASQITYQ